MLKCSALLVANSLIVAGPAAPVDPVSTVWPQSEKPVQTSPACSCGDNPESWLHARQIAAACNAVAMDNTQPTFRRLEAMKRRMKISRMLER